MLRRNRGERSPRKRARRARVAPAAREALSQAWHRYERSQAGLDAQHRISSYRADLERQLAHLIIELELHEPGYRAMQGGADAVSLHRWEINGVCIALRMLGGYAGVVFDGAWARRVFVA